MSTTVLNLTHAVPTSPAEPFFSIETFLDLEMWNLTKATLTRSESFRSSELSGENEISSGLVFLPPPYG